MADNVGSPLPKYRSHKTVRAVKITRVAGQRLHVEEPFQPFDMQSDWMQRHEPHAGGYLVIYGDGYRSFSPADPFEEGYVRVPEHETAPHIPIPEWDNAKVSVDTGEFTPLDYFIWSYEFAGRDAERFREDLANVIRWALTQGRKP